MNISPIDLAKLEYGEVIFMQKQLIKFIEAESPKVK
jgi:hypothetical protein